MFYRRDDGEVDFVVQKPDGLTPMQVSLEGLEPPHERALSSFYEAFPHRARGGDYHRDEALLPRDRFHTAREAVTDSLDSFERFSV